MKNLMIAVVMLVFASVVSAEAVKPAAQKSIPQPQVPVYVNNPNEPQPLTQWSIFQLAFLQNVPSSTGNSNVFGIKTGWPASGGIGRCFGIEASWLLAGTDMINGLQVCWVVVKNHEFNGVQASLATALNLNRFQGLQATAAYALAGNFHGGQFALITQAKNYKGIQAGLALAIADNVKGFQASAVSISTGAFDGVQCGFYNQVGEKSGALQLGLVNISEGKGMQFGLLNYNRDALIPFFPIVNFNF